MNTNTVTNTPESQNKNWALIWKGSYAVHHDIFRTTTGYWVEIQTREDATGTCIDIRISNGEAFFDACNISFNGTNHEMLAADFTDDYLGSESLKDICQHFDELCTWYGECEE